MQDKDTSGVLAQRDTVAIATRAAAAALAIPLLMTGCAGSLWSTPSDRGQGRDSSAVTPGAAGGSATDQDQSRQQDPSSNQGQAGDPAPSPRAGTAGADPATGPSLTASGNGSRGTSGKAVTPVPSSPQGGNATAPGAGHSSSKSTPTQSATGGASSSARAYKIDYSVWVNGRQYRGPIRTGSGSFYYTSDYWGRTNVGPGYPYNTCSSMDLEIATEDTTAVPDRSTLRINSPLHRDIELTVDRGKITKRSGIPITPGENVVIEALPRGTIYVRGTLTCTTPNGRK